MPHYDARERHEVMVEAPAKTVYEALHTTDFSRIGAVRLLLAARALPSALRRKHPPGTRPLRFATGVTSLIDAGFGVVAESPRTEIVLGLAGPFWQLRPQTRPLNEAAVRAGPHAGSAHALWSFGIDELEARRTRLDTETRVLTGDAASRRKLLLYWKLIRPFSGLIRILMLRRIRRVAERAGGTKLP
jgi:hypothetical protein